MTAVVYKDTGIVDAIHPSYYDACDVSCDVIYYVIAVRARRMVRIFFLPYHGNRSKSDPCSYELFCLESHMLSFPKVLQIPPESPCTHSASKTPGQISGVSSPQQNKEEMFTSTVAYIREQFSKYSPTTC